MGVLEVYEIVVQWADRFVRLSKLFSCFILFGLMKRKIDYWESTYTIFESMPIEELVSFLPWRIHFEWRGYELLIGKRSKEWPNWYYRASYVYRNWNPIDEEDYEKFENLFWTMEETLRKTLARLVSVMCEFEEEWYRHLKWLPLEIVFNSD